MGDMLSQAEIDALLGGGSTEPTPEPEPTFDSDDVTTKLQAKDYSDVLTLEQKDILGEIGNISMGTSATTLFALLGKKVLITTPVVTVNTWKDVQESYTRPCVGTRIGYKEGLKGSNILILKQHDVKIITNLMMGGEGIVPENEPLTDIDLSAIGEAMNQMIGSSSTSLSSLVKMKIDIDTPHAFQMDFTENDYFDAVGFESDERIVCISFKMEIDTLIDSRIMQILPIEFAIDMVEKLKTDMLGPSTGASTPAPDTMSDMPQVSNTQAQAESVPIPQPQQQQPSPQMYTQQYQQPNPQMYAQQYQMPDPQMYAQQQYQSPDPQMYAQQYQPPYPQMYAQQTYQQPMQMQYQQPIQQNVNNVQPVQFQNFDAASVMQQKENIGIIMDVPLEITVELGRTHKKIKEILEFSPGTIVELDKLAGEPIDILVNGKFVAKGEVVVVMDENFGVRITEIISVENRI